MSKPTTGPWLVTNPASTPTMLCVGSDLISDAETYRLAKVAIRRAKELKISFHSLTVEVGDDSQSVTLVGTMAQ